MSSVPAVLQSSQDEPQEWRRFAGALCLMMFYVLFVRGGLPFWTSGLAELRRFDFEESLRYGLADLCTAVVMYLCGRSLWLGGRWSRAWLVLAAGALVASTCIRTSFGPWHYWGPLTGNNFRPVSAAIAHVLALTKIAPFLTVLVLALWAATPSLAWSRIRLRAWTLMAVSWCFLNVAVVIVGDGLTYELHQLLDDFGAGFLALPVVAGLPALAAILLAANLPGARLVAFSLAVVAAAPEIKAAYAISLLVSTAIDALLLSGLPGPVPDFSPYPFGCFLANETFFGLTFVTPVWLAGPWILIAVFAGRYPKRLPHDDGSPFPRRYCGHCGYNLHGLRDPICPECGQSQSMTHAAGDTARGP